MAQDSERIQCAHCQANNFTTSSTCWQCGQPLRAQQDQPPPHDPAQPSQWGQEPSPEYPPPPRRDTDALVIWGFILAGLGLLCCCCPPPFAVASIVLGAVAYSRGDQRGLWVIIVGAVVLVLGSGLSIAWHPWGWIQDWHRYRLPGPPHRV